MKSWLLGLWNYMRNPTSRPGFRLWVAMRVFGRWARYLIIAPTFLRDGLIQPDRYAVLSHRAPKIIAWADVPNKAMVPVNLAAALIALAHDALPTNPYTGPRPKSEDILPWSSPRPPLSHERLRGLYHHGKANAPT